MIQHPRTLLVSLCLTTACSSAAGTGDTGADGKEYAALVDLATDAECHAYATEKALDGKPIAADLGALQALGKYVFFDNISAPPVQACASCHAPSAGWTSGDSEVNTGQVVVPGAVAERFGNRRPPTVAYASYTPAFGDSSDDLGCMDEGALGLHCQGGLFLDGRAEGNRIGDEVFKGHAVLSDAYGHLLGPLADQALDPFSNDVEQNVPDGETDLIPGASFVCQHVQAATYADLYEQAWGEPVDCADEQDLSFKRIAVAIAAFEQSAEVNPFSSRRDQALECDADSTPGQFPLQALSDEENLGHDLFFGLTSDLNPDGKNANCALCHNSESGENPGSAPKQLFTDHRYHHLGIPPNFERAGFADDVPDTGLAMHTGADRPGHEGSFRTPTLRNVAKMPDEGFVKSFMHNGYFKNLEDVVHFYNTATLKLDPEACPPGTTAAEARTWDCWPAAEFDNDSQSQGVGLLGDLGLTPAEEAALVAYLKTLSDEETVTAPADLVLDDPSAAAAVFADTDSTP